MGQQDLLLLFAEVLSKFRIPYLLTGSFASSYYGYPRATHDIDFVIETKKSSLVRLREALKTLGSAVSFSPAAFDDLSDSGIITVYHLEEATKIDFWFRNQREFAPKYARRILVRFNNVRIPLVTAEDLIITKLFWCKEIFSERHFRDCVGIWKVQKGHLDLAYLKTRAKEFGVEALLNEVAKADY